MENISTAERPPGRWRFSLRSLMLLVLLVAMSLSLAITARRLNRAEAELAEYRREYGILKIDNSTDLHAVARWTPEPGCWRWQVHFPQGRYKVCYATTGIRADDLPNISPPGLDKTSRADHDARAAISKTPINPR